MAGSSFRIEPPSVDFRDVSLKKTYKVTVKATNVARTKKTIIIDGPRSKLFKFTAAGKSTVVAPGLSVSGVLHFTPVKEEEVRDSLLIRIDDAEIIKVPLLGFPRSCYLFTDSILDFGGVAASSQIIRKHHCITNNGSAPGAFQVQYSGDPSVQLSPLSGVIEAGATLWLSVGLRTDKPRKIDEKALIKLQDRSPTALIIRAEVLDQRLEVSDLKGNPLSCLWFGPVYFGTSKMKKVVLRNNGPQACDWVCLPQDTAAGTEIGTNLRKSTAASLLERMKLCCSASQDIPQVLVWEPHQGRLDPYESVTVTVRFSPLCNRTSRKRQDLSGSRHDYCLFLLFDSVESKHGFTHPCGNTSVELAVTGSGLPVSLVSSPSEKLDFPPCGKGQSVDQVCVLRNLCTQLPINFHFRKVAHFTVQPPKGTIGPGQSQGVVLSFTARQHGSFQVCQTLDVVGHVQSKSDNTTVTELEMGSVHTVALQLSAICCDETVNTTTKHNTVCFADMKPMDKDECKGLITSRGLRRAKVFTDIYFRQPLVPDFAFTEEEKELRQRNRQVFVDLIDQWRQARLIRNENRQLDKAVREVDIGIVPCQGLVPPVPNFRDLERNKASKAKLKSKSAPLQTKSTRGEGMVSIIQQKRCQVSEAMGAVPCTNQQVAECSKTLTQTDYYKVVIGPSFVDLGEVCVNSTCVQDLDLINHLSVHVWVQLEIDCVELQGSSPLSHILPPFSRNTLPLKFQSSKPGEFNRSVSYTVNRQHPGQILVQAQVMPLTLELSTTLLALRPTPTSLAQSAYRGSVTLRNLQKHPAEFKWKPVVTEGGILFSIRPATGVVEPQQELDCEVVWYPSYSSPSEGAFDLCVEEGSTQRLHCVAKLGSTTVLPAESQLTLGSVPLNVTSERTAVLHNTGQNHAYYQVLDESPLPGLVVSPCEGVVPSQGQATLKIHFRPNSVTRFDTRVRIALRGMKPIEFRMGGSVDPPNVHISVSCFQFHGVHIGSQRVIHFALTNHSLAMAQVVFNLTQHPDFSLQLPQPSCELEAGLSIMKVQSQETKKCSLVLSPTQATNYDFNLPMWVNGIRWPLPSTSPPPLPSSPSAVNRKPTAVPFSRSVTMAMERPLHIQATVLHALLEMSLTSLRFHVQPLPPDSDIYTKTVKLKEAHEDSLCWRGVVNETVRWSLDYDAIVAEEVRERQLCTLTPSSGCLRPIGDMKPSGFRPGGSLDPPTVHISVSHVQLHGIYIGYRREIHFTLTNHSLAMAHVVFNLTQHPDVFLKLPQPTYYPLWPPTGAEDVGFLAFSQAELEAGLSIMELQSQESKECSLVFSPVQPTYYDYLLWDSSSSSYSSSSSTRPVCPCPSSPPAPPLCPCPSSSRPVCPCPSAPPAPPLCPRPSSPPSSPLAVNQKPTALPFSRLVTMATPRSLHIRGTVLHALLEMSPTSLQFHVQPLAPESDVNTKTVELKAAHEDSLCWRGVINETVRWSFDCSAIAALAEGSSKRELCTLTPSSGFLRPSQSVCVSVSIRPEAIRTASERLIKLSLPLYLGDKANGEMEYLHYGELTVVITVLLPSITFLPPQILLTPVPLKSNTTFKLTLLAVGYPSGTRISAYVDDVKLYDRTKLQPISIVFPEGDCIPAPNKDQKNAIQSQGANVASLVCAVSFCSAIPLSVCTSVTFTEFDFNTRFKVKLCAIADNCLLTVWPYLALHGSEQQIVLKKGATSVETILQLCETPSPPSVPASSSSSFNSSTNGNSTSGSDSGSDQTRTDGASPNQLDNLGLPEFPDSDLDDAAYHHEVVLAVERWFSLFGWADGPHPISVPHTLRRVDFKTLMGFSRGRTYRVSQNKDSRSIIDMLCHLSIKVIPGIPRCTSFSTEKDKRTQQLIVQHKAMLSFLRVQGASLWHIRPEYLLDVEEFQHWCSLQSNEEERGFDYSSVNYESLSKRSWTDVLLQIYKVFVICRVMEKDVEQDGAGGTNTVNTKPLTSNVYSACELHLLSWLNRHYENMRTTVWGIDNVPSARWIVNFDLDLTDGLVFAALLAAYCPYLIGSHLQRMYPTPSSLEQILHNNIIVVRALTLLSLNIDVQPTDLSDPNPIQMLMLCVHLYERLPQYLPLTTVTLSGSLHSTFSKQVRLKSPASKPVKYQVLILGEDARFFSVAGGSVITIQPQARSELSVQYQCSFLQSMEAVLLLITSPAFGLSATTLAFKLRTQISNIKPTKTVRCMSPCFELSNVQLPITNPFSEEANFRVVLVESTNNPLINEKKKQSPKSKINERTPDMNGVGDGKVNLSHFHVEDREFLSPVTCVCLKPGQTDTLSLHYLPFLPGPKYCSVLLVCPLIGDMVYMVKATGEMPLPSPLNARPSSNIILIPGESVLSLRCKVDQVCKEVVRVPLINMALEKALAIWGQQRMTAEEHRRRTLTQTLCSSTVRATAALHKLFNQQALRFNGVLLCKVAEYSVEASLPQYVKVPSTVEIPVKEDTNIPWEEQTDCGYVDIPVRFQADCVGTFTCQIVLKSSCDIRVYLLEAVVTSKGESTHLDFTSPVHYSVTEKIPITNETDQDWSIHAEIMGEGFCGPKVLYVPTRTMVTYPLTFHPSSQGTIKGKLSLHNDYNGTVQVFILRGVGERPLPVDSPLSHRPKEKITDMDAPKYS